MLGPHHMPSERSIHASLHTWYACFACAAQYVAHGAGLDGAYWVATAGGTRACNLKRKAVQCDGGGTGALQAPYASAAGCALAHNCLFKHAMCSCLLACLWQQHASQLQGWQQCSHCGMACS